MPSASFMVKQIKVAGRSFAKDELAFLALTWKVERAFLDRLALGRPFPRELTCATQSCSNR